MRVHRYTHDLAIAITEILESLVKRDDFGWTNEGEIQGIEEQYHILPAQRRQAKLLVKTAVRGHSRGDEIRCLSGD
jgi:hypothetical protein